MSLTSILSDKRVSAKLREDFLIPPFDLKAELKAPPLTKNYSIVGTAFDYLMRFHLDRYNTYKVTQRGYWVADSSFRVLMRDLSKPSLMGKGQTKFYRSRSTSKSDKQELIKLISNQYGQSKANYLAYIENGNLTDEFVSDTIFLAKLDTYYRTSGNGKIDFFDPSNSDDITDLKRLLSLIESKHFMAKHKCYLNPTFGDASYLVSGADADVIIDNTLIEIKVVKDLRLLREHFNQIIGYYILSGTWPGF